MVYRGPQEFNPQTSSRSVYPFCTIYRVPNTDRDIVSITRCSGPLNLLPSVVGNDYTAKGQWQCLLTGKVTVCLASYWRHGLHVVCLCTGHTRRLFFFFLEQRTNSLPSLPLLSRPLPFPSLLSPPRLSPSFPVFPFLSPSPPSPPFRSSPPLNTARESGGAL